MLKLIRFLKPYKKQVILGPVFKLLEAIFELLLPTMMVFIVDKGIKTRNVNFIFHEGLIMTVMVFLGYASSCTCQYFASIASQGFGTSVRNEAFKKIGTFSYEEIDHFKTSSLVNRLTNDINQMQLAVAMMIRLGVRVPFLCIGGVIMAMFLDLKLSNIMLLSLPFFAFALFLIMHKTIPMYKLVQAKLDSVALVLRENLSGVRIIRAFSRTEHERKRFKKANDDLAGMAVHVGKISALMTPVTNIIMNISVLLILWFGGIRVNIGAMTQGKIIAYINYVNLVLTALIIVANLIVTFTRASASASRVNEIFETQSSIKYKNEIMNNKVSDKDGSSINFENVSFSYPDSKGFAISGVSFDVKCGQTIGIIGGTGSGKTTITNLIMRFYDATKGRILIEGNDIKNYSKDELIKKIGIVPQKAVLFSGTIEENIKWGNENASLDEVKNAAKIAQISDFIESLPEKYNTMVSQEGTNFSGGQKQRLTIARALVKKPSILILDDSSSALDFATDSALRKAIRENTKGMTVVMIAQRVNAIKNSDMIIVIEEGKVSDIGTHEELTQNSEIYKEICSSQLSKKVKCVNE